MGIRLKRFGTLALAVTLAAVTACSSDDDGGSATTTIQSAAPSTDASEDTVAPSPASSPTSPTDTAAPEPDPPTTDVPLETATFTVQPGTEQVAILDADAGTEVQLLDASGAVVATGDVDEQGSLLFREVASGTGYLLRTETEASIPFDVVAADAIPDPSIYSEQDLLPAGGFGYITTRDGTTLSANVVLPGPVEDGPYPTVLEYSGYQPSDPGSADLAGAYSALGFAYVGVNMRGTGCSGGSYRFFETVQSLDGYDAIEAVAAQPWVLDHRVGMVGISYPGISQLFVAATRPPSLAAITPLSVLDDSYRSTLYPGGLLNTGFAVEWTQDRQDQSAPYGQEWTQERADDGDERCAANQALRLQNPDLVEEIRANPYYSPELGDAIAPSQLVGAINVPVFLAGAWQDEQTGGRFPVMLDRFTSSPHLYVTLTNGLHTESLMPGVFQRYAEFLQLYVGKTVPDMTAVNGIVPVLGSAISGESVFPTYTSRFAGQTYEEALLAFESEPMVVVNFEEGAADGLTPGTPYPRFTATFDAWPVPEAVTTAWYLRDGGALRAEPPAGAETVDRYVADPTALPSTFYEGGGSSQIWQADVEYDWQPLPDGTGVAYATPPLDADTTIVGSGSVDLWIAAEGDEGPIDDTDVEVTITEIRPDGEEVYVQSGWLRASQRALDESASTELHPAHTHLEADVEPLAEDEPTAVRVELFPFAHVFRAGSRIRLTIDAPGNNRPVWIFETISDGETVFVSHDADHPSRVVLPVVAVDAPAGTPVCGSLRGQPCREYVAAANGG
jgi:uncharacterized protein